jgi:antirestriction protein
LPQFMKQLKDFNETAPSEKFSKVKDDFVKSFSNEIKSYESFKDYLMTNNSTANELSNDYLSEALNYETIARNTFTAAVNNGSK